MNYIRMQRLKRAKKLCIRMYFSINNKKAKKNGKTITVLPSNFHLKKLTIEIKAQVIEHYLVPY